MSEEKVIAVKPNRKDFEEIYFSGNQGSLLFSPAIKSKTIITIISAVIVLAAFLLKDHLSEESFGILYFLSFVFLLCAVYLSVGINKISKWKKEVQKYLKSHENCHLYEIRYNDQFFTVTIDNQKESSEWKDFIETDMNDKYISLEGKYSYMFPKKSMNEKDYHLLKRAIKDKIKRA